MTFFEKCDPDYLISPAEIIHPVREVIATIASTVGKTILDAGCNVGMSYPYCKRFGLDYTGIDFQPKFIKRAQELHPDGNFRPGNILALPFEDGSFDVAFCKDVLEHLEIPGYVTAIQELWRVATRLVMLSFYREPAKDARIHYHDAGFWDNIYSRKDIEAVIDALDGVGERRGQTVGEEKTGRQTLLCIFKKEAA